MAHEIPEVEPRRGLGRHLGMTTLGSILPGSGLLLSGHPIIGGLLLLGFVTLVVGAAAFIYVKGITDAALFFGVRPDLLIGMVAALVVGLVILAASVIHTSVANWPSRPQTGKRVVAGLFTTLLVLGIMTPAVPAVQYVSIHKDTVSEMFGHNDIQRGANAATPQGTGEDAWRNFPRVNVMLIGSDAYPGRPGVRTDSMMVASIDTKTGDTVLFGIPRNLENVPFEPDNPLHKVWPEGFNCGDKCLMNEVWTQAEEHKDLYPGDPMPGLTATRQTLSGILGLNIDYAVVIDIRGFSSLVDAMGGVDINVRERTPIGGRRDRNDEIVPGSITGWIEAGPQHLNGYQAMWYSRSRVLNNDFNRMARQRCMVGALVKQVNPTVMLERYPALAKVAREHIYTDVPAEHLQAWAELVSRMQKGTIRSLPFTNKIVKVVDPDWAHIRQVVQQAISPNPVEGTPAPPAPTGTTSPSPTPSTTPSGTGTTSNEPKQGLVNVANAC